ncbi:hypothetical protein [Oceanobacillus kapialis]|uniref:Uncharacterized protein n=1 Tax=Oceanobacillus kapialis TaxID=481353 RepID=A0ABW5PWF6_9BACI
MNRVLASVTAPVLIYIFLVIYGVIVYTINSLELPPIFSLAEFLTIYLISFAFCFFIGIPLSFIIDKIKGIRGINYTLAGGIIYVILMIKNNIEHSRFFIHVDSLLTYSFAGLAFFISLKIMEILFQKLSVRYSK